MLERSIATRSIRLASLLGLACLALNAAQAQLPPPPKEAMPAEAMTAAEVDPAAAFEASLRYQTGSIALPGGLAALSLSPAFRYLDPADTERLLVEAWGNPSGDGTLGMILPADVSPLSMEGWGVIVTYSDEGHVSDSDAGDIDYVQLLSDMQAATEEESQARIEAGQPGYALIGWADQPRYDATEKKLFWAKEIKFGDAPENTLNYNVRVLGREGVLVLNAVASMGQLQPIRTAMADMLPQVSFTAGNTYADFDASTDKAAAYGVAALIAGGLAAKSGLLAKLLVLLFAAKKLVGVIVIGGIAWAWSWLRGRKSKDEVGS